VSDVSEAMQQYNKSLVMLEAVSSHFGLQWFGLGFATYRYDGHVLILFLSDWHYPGDKTQKNNRYNFMYVLLICSFAVDPRLPPVLKHLKPNRNCRIIDFE
jgi:hypothetical protein